ncbi:endonuclease domain-containing protein [Streptomyces vinaceus]|uniref:endonuclease domain-containing protein n=1 Tax=Streptomyces vinaceus TaxID=1960 RepID=UPI0036A54772
MNRFDRLIILIGQGFGCAICGSKNPGTMRSVFVLDHDHACCPGGNGKKCGVCVRGALCSECNLMLGRYENLPSFLQTWEVLNDYINRKRRTV